MASEGEKENQETCGRGTSTTKEQTIEITNTKGENRIT